MSSSTVLDIATYLLEYLYTQLQCSPNGVPCVKKLSVCEPQDVCCDYLAVFIDGIGGSELIDLAQCGGSTKVDVGFRVKLMRPCNDQSQCNPSIADQTAVQNILVDSVVLRSALTRFTSRLGAFLGDAAYGSTIQILPMETVCGPTEQCSGWITGVVVNMELCDDGSCTDMVVIPNRCDSSTDTTIIPTDAETSITPY